MDKQRVLLTGATGTMGFCGLKEILHDSDEVSLSVLARPSDKNRALLAPYQGQVDIQWGDFTDYASVKRSVGGADIVLHVGAFVSPKADYFPKETMAANYGGTVKIIRAIKELGQESRTKLVYIGTVAETGDRMPPVHWGRAGDPIKTSVFDYYGVSKVAAERAVIESGLRYWTSLRQTGIVGPAMSRIRDAIMFHNCLDNVLEYASDRDSGRLLRNLCAKDRKGLLGGNFWGHIFNIGGGPSCRVSTAEMYRQIFGALGIKRLSSIMDSKWIALRNFHGQYYLDSDKLEEILHFRHDSMQYFYDSYLEVLGGQAAAARFMTKLPGGQKLIGGVMRKEFLKLASGEHGTVRFIGENMEGHIAAYWGSREAWEAIPPIDEFRHFGDWDRVVHISRGYDEDKAEDSLSIGDLKEAAKYRGGECLSQDMQTGDWSGSLSFRCAFGHQFEASPRLVLEGGHWCPVCERESWNYYERAKRDPFFAQVWTPLHPASEKPWTYPKEVSELDAAG
jgi:nucleoside-diphosphate-sugar epimerase